MPAAGVCRHRSHSRRTGVLPRENNQRQRCELRGSSATKRPRSIRPCPGHATPVAPMKNGARPSNQFQHARAKSPEFTVRSSTRTPGRDGCPWSVHPPGGVELVGRVLTHSRPNGRMARPPPKGKRHCKDFFTNRPRRSAMSSTTSVIVDLWAGSGLVRTFVGVQIQAVGSARVGEADAAGGVQGVFGGAGDVEDGLGRRPGSRPAWPGRSAKPQRVAEPSPSPRTPSPRTTSPTDWPGCGTAW